MLNTKSGFRRFLRAREYHKVANGVHRHVKVAFICDLSYHISYHFLHSLYRTEPITDASISPNRVHYPSRKLVGLTLCSQYMRTRLVYGSEDVYRTARSLYQCWLSCMNAFPSSLTQDKWVVDAWNEACHRTDANPNTLRQDEGACPVLLSHVARLHRIFRLNVIT